MADNINIYTDGSCNHIHKIGAWAAILLIDDNEILISGHEENTTHNRMELSAVIKAIEHIFREYSDHEQITIYTDSQYVVNLQIRKEKLVANQFRTKRDVPIQNDDLVEKLIGYMEKYPVSFVKVKAHLKKGVEKNYNRMADQACRKIMRERINKL